MTKFGAGFRQARVSKGISLDQIATETRISKRFLNAIENEEFQLLPGGIFNRGFVRAFAEKVGLDPEQAVADYERTAEVPQADAPAPSQPALASRQSRLYPIAVGVLALVIVVVYNFTKESDHIARPASAPAPVAAPTTARKATSVASRDNRGQTTVPGPAAPSHPSPERTRPSTPAPSQAAAGGAPNAISLEIDTKDPCWIKVVADGESENPGEILQSGMVRKYTAQNKLMISVGNAGGITLKLNDKPMKAIGTSGQVREIVITPETAKNFIAP